MTSKAAKSGIQVPTFKHWYAVHSSTYRSQFGTDDVEEQCEHIKGQAELADPCSDACWDVSQHGGQGVPAAEEPGGGLERRQWRLSHDVIVIVHISLPTLVSLLFLLVPYFIWNCFFSVVFSVCETLLFCYTMLCVLSTSCWLWG